MKREELLKFDFGKIGVLMGGASSEREISLKSGKAVYQTLNSAKLDVVAIDLTVEDKQAVANTIRDSGINVAFIALHGKFGEDGKIQSILEDIKIPYTGSGVEASRLAMDKIESRKIFEKNQIPVPNYKVFGDKTKANAFSNDYKFNSSVLVVKPAAQGSSVGVSFVENNAGLSKAIVAAFEYDDSIIVEDYLSGREITIGILDDESLPIVEILPKKKFFDYEAKYQKGLTEYDVPAKIDANIYKKAQDIGLLAHKSLGCRSFSRVDMILKDNTPYVLEVNSIPGMTETSLLPKAAKFINIDFLELCLRLIKYAYGKEKS